MNAYRRAVEPNRHLSDPALLLARAAIGLLFIDHAVAKYTAKGGLGTFKGFLEFIHVPAAGLFSQVVPLLELAGGAPRPRRCSGLRGSVRVEDRTRGELQAERDS